MCVCVCVGGWDITVALSFLSPYQWLDLGWWSERKRKGGWVYYFIHRYLYNDRHSATVVNEGEGDGRSFYLTSCLNEYAYLSSFQAAQRSTFWVIKSLYVEIASNDLITYMTWVIWAGTAWRYVVFRGASWSQTSQSTLKFSSRLKKNWCRGIFWVQYKLGSIIYIYIYPCDFVIFISLTFF